MAVLGAGAIPGGGCASGPAERLQRLNLPGARTDLPFSHVVVHDQTIYVAGTLGLEPGTGKPPAEARREAELALEEIRRKLRLAGAEMDDLVWVQVFCSDLTLYEEFNSVYRTYFQTGFPARSFIGSGPLLFGSRFEINGIAVKR
jgi:enamine deaminase RidA (YjgF/YER057c/UK114 family)